MSKVRIVAIKPIPSLPPKRLAAGTLTSVKITEAEKDSKTFNRFAVSDAILDGEPYFGYRSISAGLLAFLNPPNLYNKENFQKLVQKIGNKEDAMDKISEVTTILNVFFIISLYFFNKALLEGAFMLISRMVYLIRWVVTAPIYFAQSFLPSGRNKMKE